MRGGRRAGVYTSAGRREATRRENTTVSGFVIVVIKLTV
jgi:hypothetical protein